jgi:hypothetical protein
MGGTNEFAAPATVAKSIKAPVEIGQARIHESGGKIHFHADAQGLKVSVPVANWFSAWEGISQTPGEWTFVDQNTAVTIATKIENGILDAAINIFAIQTGTTYGALQKFTVGA